MVEVARTANNTLSGTPRVIYMDAGVWGGPEKGMPKMTFGLLEHNGIALCTYFSDGHRAELPDGSQTTQLPNGDTIDYDFFSSNMSTFLGLLMEKKYGKKFGQRDFRKSFHVKKLLPFRDNALLDDPKALRIFIPDLHLHYFKDTYLDNFVTYYGNRCDSLSITPVKLAKRTSMAVDLGIFLEAVAAYQQTVSKTTYVHVLGDLCELWETESIIRYYQSHDHARECYKALNELGNFVADHIAPSADARFQRIKSYVKELVAANLQDVPLDAETKRQLDALYATDDWDQFLFEFDEDRDVVRERARAIQEKILKKHKTRGGKSLFDYLGSGDLVTSKYFVWGNHDNYIMGINNPNDTIAFSNELEPRDFPWGWTWTNCDMMVAHGHNMDLFNNDRACGLGRLITALLTFYELKSRGDFVRQFESVFRSPEEVRIDYMKGIARLCYLQEQNDRAAARRNKIVVFAHTHIPDLLDMTNQVAIYKWLSDAGSAASAPSPIDAHATRSRMR